VTENRNRRTTSQPDGMDSIVATDPQVVELPEIITKSPRNATQEARWQLYRRLVEQDGIKCEAAAQLCGFAPEYGYQINQKLKARGQTVATIPEKLYRKADRRAAQILDAKPWGSMKEVRDSAVTSVISEIWRRKYPTKSEPVPENINFTTVCLDSCKPGHPSYEGDLVRPESVSPLELAGEDPAIIPDGGITPDEEPPEGTP